jgi:hypothetical protein
MARLLGGHFDCVLLHVSGHLEGGLDLRGREPRVRGDSEVELKQRMRVGANGRSQGDELACLRDPHDGSGFGRGAAIPEECVDSRRKQCDGFAPDGLGRCDGIFQLHFGQPGLTSSRDVVFDAGSTVGPDARSDRGELLLLGE